MQAQEFRKYQNINLLLRSADMKEKRLRPLGILYEFILVFF